MQLSKTMYIDLVETLPKITHIRRMRKAIAIEQITAQCVAISKKEKQITIEAERGGEQAGLVTSRPI